MEWLNFVVNNPIFVALAETLLHFAWQGLLLASLLMFLLKSIDNRHSNLRYNLSLLVLALCLAAPVTTFSMVYDPYMEPITVDVKQAMSQVSVSVSQVGAAIGGWNEPNNVSWSIATAELLDGFSDWRLESISPFLAIAWMAGVVLMSSRLVLQLVNVYKLPQQGTSDPDAQLQQIFDRLMLQLEVTLAARLFISTRVDVPMVIGWLKPVVLLPSAMVVGLTPKQLEMLLAHELAHVRRHDYLVNFVQTLVEVMLFFHPGVKWISKQIRTERECCCDDVAIAHCGSPVAYASALTDAEMSRFNNIPQLAMAASGSDLKHRVFRAVGQADCASGFNGQWVSGMLAALMSMGIVFLMFSADVIGMTSHVDKPNKNNPLLVVVEPPGTNAEQATIVPAEYSPIVSAQDKSEQEPLVEMENGNVLSENEATTKNEITTAKETEQPEEPANVEQKVSSTANIANESQDALVANAIPEVETKTASPLNDANTQEIAVPAADSSDDVAPVEIETAEIKAAVTESSDVTKPLEATADAKPQSVEVSQNLETSQNAETFQNVNSQPLDSAPTTETGIAQQVAEIEAIVIQEPVLLRSSTPDYPPQALRRKWSEEVLVKFVVNERGRVEQIAFEGEVRRVFRESVRKALKKWQFEPAMKDGEAVSMELSKLFSFSDPVQNAITGSRIARL